MSALRRLWEMCENVQVLLALGAVLRKSSGREGGEGEELVLHLDLSSICEMCAEAEAKVVVDGIARTCMLEGRTDTCLRAAARRNGWHLFYEYETGTWTCRRIAHRLSTKWAFMLSTAKLRRRARNFLR